MHVLVTGGAGFIGSHLVEFHLNQGDSVLAVDDLSTGSLENIKPFLKNSNFRFEEADILTWPEIEKAVCWADRVYHMAAVLGSWGEGGMGFARVNHFKNLGSFSYEYKTVENEPGEHKVHPYHPRSPWCDTIICGRWAQVGANLVFARLLLWPGIFFAKNFLKYYNTC